MSAVPAAIEWLWAEFHKFEPRSQLGGIYADKKGYHNTRNRNVAKWPGNYSYAQFADDRLGSGDLAAAIDITFPDAQAGNYATIEKYSDRLVRAGHAGRKADPRTIYMREFFGQCDTDRDVEGWDFAKAQNTSSDASHLWHIHISIHRRYANDMNAMRAILSILKGETVAQWLGVDVAAPITPEVPNVFRIKAADSSARYLSNGVHIASTELDNALEKEHIPLVEVKTTAELRSLLPAPAAPVVTGPITVTVPLEALKTAIREVLAEGVARI